MTGPKVTIVAPVPDEPGRPIEVLEGATLSFEATATSPSQAAIRELTWRFGAEEKRGAEVSYTFTSSTDATVSAEDEFGVRGEATIAIRVCQAAGTKCTTLGGVSNPCCSGLSCDADASGANHTCR